MLLASLAALAVKKNLFTTVRIILFNACKISFEKNYPELKELGVVIDEAESLSDIPAPSSNSKSSSCSALFIDTVTKFLQNSAFDGSLRLLKFLSNRGSVVTRVFGEELSDSYEKRLRSVTDVFLDLNLTNSGLPLCKLFYFKRTGKPVVKKQTFVIDESLKISTSDYKEIIKLSDLPNTADSKTWKLPDISFDLGLNLSESEREAKESVVLPFVAAQHRKGPTIDANGDKKVRVGGRIIYTPDDADDLDDSDPDDDLEI